MCVTTIYFVKRHILFLCSKFIFLQKFARNVLINENYKFKMCEILCCNQLNDGAKDRDEDK